MVIVLITGLALGSPAFASASEITHAVRCDGAHSDAHFEGCVLGATSQPFPGFAPDGRYCGLNVINETVRCFHLVYEPELRRYHAMPDAVPGFMTGKLTLLAEAYRLDFMGFNLAKQYYADVSILRDGPHDPVRVSVNGWQSSDRGRMNRAVNSCLSDLVCVRQIDWALAQRMQASERYTGGGGQVGPLGGSVSWNYFPAELGPPAAVWFCESSDCALYQFENNSWVFKETRARRGAGPAYGNPDNQQTLSWGSGRDAQDVWIGMRGAGYPMMDFLMNHQLVCGWINGVFDSCRWIAQH
ncbi:hypothetical protein [Aquimonas voraii]|nr:hypothetical protein [Aquimonas voraii]